MNASHIAHIGIAVRSIEATLPLYRDGLGLEYVETVEMRERGIRIAFIRAGASLIELIEPLHEESEVSRFLEKRGEGIHHICFGVPDIKETIAHLKEHGVRMVNEEPSIGAEGLPVAFLHPRSAFGVLMEVIEESPHPAS
jgi:methylmalonyl-CoA/ethylmalonyl-CoA epimerase